VRRINLAQLQTRLLLAIDIPTALVQTALLLALAQFGALSANTALLGVAAASGLSLVWFSFQSEQVQFHATSALHDWISNQRFGGWMLLVSLAWVVGDTSYRWLLGSLSGIEALGEFTAAQSIVLAVNPFLLAVSNLARATAARRIARDGTANLIRTTIYTTAFLGLLAGVFLAALALLGGPLVRAVFGAEFSGQGSVVAALCAGMFAHSLLVPVDAVLAALERGQALFIASATRMIVIIGAGVPLIWWRGAEGVGYAIALGCLAAVLVQWFVLTRDLNWFAAESASR
jgi:O-antigen/teichoic acid export membrane protein